MSITLSNIDNFLYETRAPMQRNFRRKHVLQEELKRIARKPYDGNKVRVPVQLVPMQGGGNPGESGTINVPHGYSTIKAEATLEDIVQPFKVTLDAEEDASGDNSAAELNALNVMNARNAMAEIENDQFNHEGALLATVTGGTSPGLVATVSTSATNFALLYPGRIVDFLTRSTGADPGQGLRRKIDAIDRSAGTVTFSTTSQASDGGSGNMTIANTAGIYIPGTYGNALASVWDIADDTDESFQGVDRGTYPGWAGVDGRDGTTTTVMLSDSVLDAGVVRASENGGEDWDFAMAHPSVINGYKQSKASLTRYTPDEVTIKSGRKGIAYLGANKPIALIAEIRFKRGKCVLVPLEDWALYAPPKFASGPDFDKTTGSMAQRFDRSLPYEVWLRDRVNLVALRCNRTVSFENLDEA